MSAEVLEGGAVDVGRGLAAWTESRSGERKGRPAMHPRFKKKTHTVDRLVLEDLDIAGIMSNQRLARAVGDAAWGELARQIIYKQKWRSGQVLVADRWFPSSKTCSACGTLRKDLTLKDRTYTCDHCGLVLDRT